MRAGLPSTHKEFGAVLLPSSRLSLDHLFFLILMRAIFLIFCLCVLVSAVPTIKGEVKLVKTEHLKPTGDHTTLVRILVNLHWHHELMQQIMQQSVKQKRCQHPCVVVSNPDDHGEVKVATLSHRHLQGVKTKPANDYAPFERHPVLGGSSISVDPPRMVHASNLKDATREPKSVKPDKLQKLIKDISTCVFELTLRGIYFFLSDKNCPPNQQLAGVCAHADPHHDSPGHTSPQHRLQTVTRKRKWRG